MISFKITGFSCLCINNLGTEQGIRNLQNQLQTRDLELNKEKRMRKQLEQQFEKSTEKRLIKELLPNRKPSNINSKNSPKSPARYYPAHSPSHKPIPVATGQLMNNNRVIHALPTTSTRYGPRVGAYF